MCPHLFLVLKTLKKELPFSFKAVLRREYSGLFAITLCFTIVDYLRYTAMVLFDNITDTQWIRLSLILLIIMGVLMIILRSLKHHTTLLDADSNRD